MSDFGMSKFRPSYGAISVRRETKDRVDMLKDAAGFDSHDDMINAILDEYTGRVVHLWNIIQRAEEAAVDMRDGPLTTLVNVRKILAGEEE